MTARHLDYKLSISPEMVESMQNCWMVDPHAKSSPSYMFRNFARVIGLRFRTARTRASAPFSSSKPVLISNLNNISHSKLSQFDGIRHIWIGVYAFHLRAVC
jgi:hypothetical protein